MSRASAVMRRGSGTSGRLTWIVTVLLLLLGTGTAAYAFWASSTSSSNAAAAADSLSAGSRPEVTASGAALTVTWAAGTTVNGHNATGYTITRYAAAAGGTGTPATGGCAGTVGALTCTEQNVPGGIWYYTVTPTIALWTGEESARSTGTSSDSAAPVATVQSVSPAPNAAGWNNTSPVTVTVTADDGAAGSGVASITYAVDGGAKQTVGAAVATIPVTGEGTHSVSYFATDNAGNAGAAQTQTVKIDTTAPAAPGLSVPAYVNSANVAAVPVSGTAEAGSTVSVTAGDDTAHSVTVTATVSGTGTWSASLDLGSLNQGTITYSATATDATGNTGTAATVNRVKDTLVPAAPGLVVPEYVNIGNVSAVPVSGAAEAGGSIAVTITDGGGQAMPASATVSGSGSWSASPNLTILNQGTLTYRATVTDAAGNISSATSATDTKDTQAPGLTLAAPRWVNSMTVGNLQVGGTAEAGVTVTLTTSGAGRTPLQATASSLGNWSVSGLDLTGFKDGALTFTATTNDAAGNSTSVTAPAPNTKDVELPIFTGIAGTDGNKAGLDRGDLITISFSEAMDPAKFCPGWTGSALTGTVTLANGASTGNDAVSFSSAGCTGLNLGIILLGADYVGTTPVTFSGNGNNASTLTWDSAGKALTVKFGAASGTVSNPTQGFPSYSPPSGLTDLAGNPLGTSNPTITRTAF